MIESNPALSVERRRPCRKKARIMACGRRASKRARVARDIPDDDELSALQNNGSSRVENFVDNHPRRWLRHGERAATAAVA
jgi:hypothetical protein